VGLDVELDAHRAGGRAEAGDQLIGVGQLALGAGLAGQVPAMVAEQEVDADAVLVSGGDERGELGAAARGGQVALGLEVDPGDAVAGGEAHELVGQHRRGRADAIEDPLLPHEHAALLVHRRTGGRLDAAVAGAVVAVKARGGRGRRGVGRLARGGLDVAEVVLAGALAIASEHILVGATGDE
jgi:hypothetical protein